jgi:uncharacterized protein (DUF924 family)
VATPEPGSAAAAAGDEPRPAGAAPAPIAPTSSTYEDVLDFWFVETAPQRWWTADPAFDAAIVARFEAVHGAAARGELYEWRRTPRGRLAEIVVLDQFSRHLFRGTARAYAYDPMALVLAQEAVAGAHDRALVQDERQFVYLPFTHSESRLIHVQAERLYASLGRDDSYDSEVRHQAIIDRFGRYPHRNAALGRESTPEELAFLEQPGSRF